MYAFLRHSRKARATVLVVCNFSPKQAMNTCVHIPRNAQEWAGKTPGMYSFVDLLKPESPALTVSDEQLDTEGLPVTVPAGEALLLEWR